MLSETLSKGLEAYGIGAKIRALRAGKKLGLVQLGHHTGLSPALLSKIERSQIFPTLPTLLRIALVFGVGLEHFFAPESGPRIAVVRRSERVQLPNRPGESEPAYLFESLDYKFSARRFEAFLAKFQQGAPAAGAHRHAGIELLYVIEGMVAITIDGQETILGEGDAITFDSNLPHDYRVASNAEARAIVVVKPEAAA